MTAPHPPSELELERRGFRRRQTTRSVLIALASTLVFAILVWVFVIRTPGWTAFRGAFLDLDSWRLAWPRVAAGFLVNLQILGVAVVAVAIVGGLLAAARTTRSPVLFPLRVVATAYTDLFRGLPLIVVLYLVGFGTPAIVNTRIPFAVLGTIALVLTYSSYVAEVLRAGLDAVHPSQRLAARALGLSNGQTLRIVLLPQALRNVTPALMNDFVAMQKDVGLVSVLGAVDAVRAAQIVSAQVADYTPYVVAGLLFVVLAIPCIRFVDWYSARLRRRERIGSIV